MTQTEFDKLVKQLNDYSFDIMANKRLNTQMKTQMY